MIRLILTRPDELARQLADRKKEMKLNPLAIHEARVWLKIWVMDNCVLVVPDKEAVADL